jgi:DNA (cytosine-5)-methyltransferase 1
MMLRVGSLFSGIGGLDLGLERAGMKIVWQVEKDPYCQKVLKKHWPEVPCYGDIKEIDFTAMPTVDLICGGFPCQPVSCAGKQQGDKDERWLWPEFYRAICEARPRWILVENVPGLLSVSNGRLFGGILGDLASIGYDAEWDLLSSEKLGAWHKRERLFLIANSDRFGLVPGKFFKEINHCECVGTWPPIATYGFDDSLGRRYPRLAPNLGVGSRIPLELDRLKCLGNAVVPQVAEWIGKQIIKVITEAP